MPPVVTTLPQGSEQRVDWWDVPGFMAERPPVRLIKPEHGAGPAPIDATTEPLKELDLENPPPPVDELVDDVLEMSGLTFLAGVEGSGKTLAALDLSIAMLSGEKWLGRFETHLKLLGDGRGGIVYLDEENGRGRMFRRLERLMCPRGGARPELLMPHLSVLPMLGITDANPEMWHRFVRHCFEREPALIIVDTLRAVFTGDEDSSTEAEAFVRKLRRLQRAAGGPALLILAHPGKNKSKGIRGSSRWSQAADSVINLVSLPGKGCVKGWHWEKMRDGAGNPMPFAFAIEDHTQDGAFGIRLTPAGMSGADKARELKKLHPDWTQGQIADSLDMSQSAVSRALAEMDA